MANNSAHEIAVLEVGFGNVPSLARVLRQLGSCAKQISTPEEILRAERLIVPGVGSFHSAMSKMHSLDLIETLRMRCVELNRPTLGICLGAQILFEEGLEGGKSNGIGILRGSIDSFKNKFSVSKSHTGWAQIQITDSVLGMSSGSFVDVYFNHDYIFPTDLNHVCAVATHGKEFPVIVRHNMTYAVQFHPEKSQKVGLRLLEAFIKDS